MTNSVRESVYRRKIISWLTVSVCGRLAPMVRRECWRQSRDAYLTVTATKGVGWVEERQTETERQMHTENIRMPSGLESFNRMLSSDPS